MPLHLVLPRLQQQGASVKMLDVRRLRVVYPGNLEIDPRLHLRNLGDFVGDLEALQLRDDACRLDVLVKVDELFA